MDDLVACTIANMRELDEGPLPLFDNEVQGTSYFNGTRQENPNADVIVRPVYKDRIRKGGNLIYDPGAASNIPFDFLCFYYDLDYVRARYKARTEAEAARGQRRAFEDLDEAAEEPVQTDELHAPTAEGQERHGEEPELAVAERDHISENQG